MELKIYRKDFDALLEHAKRMKPSEAVAILLGTVDEGGVVVRKVKLTRNILNSPVEFHVEPAELYEAYREADRLGLEVVGIFHSHPAPPHPSSLDVKFMKLNPVVWIITSLLDWSTRAYIFKKELKEVNLKIMEKTY